MKHMDYIYLEEDYYKTKKETFSFLIDLIKDTNNFKDGYSLLDIGCAKGELLYHIKKDLPNYEELCGLDYSNSLIDSTKNINFLNDINFKVGSGEDFDFDRTFDFIVSAGVVGYFDSLDNFLSMVDKHLNKGGTALVFHLFNPHDIDVIVRYRNNKYFDEFQPGWNVHSIETSKKALQKIGLKLENIHTFKLSFNDKPKEDPARSWTSIVDEDKKFINGLGQVFDLICLEIKK